MKLLISISAILVALIFLGNFVFLMNNSSFYSSEFSKLGVNATTAANVVSFVSGKSPLGSEFNNTESSHLKDVKRILTAVKQFYYTSVILLAAAVIYLFKSGKFLQLMPKTFILSGSISLLLLLAIFLASLNFDSFFSLLHKPFFSSGTWLFPADSLLISLFPEQFFSDFARTFFILVLVNSSAFLIIGLFVRKMLKKRILNVFAKPSLRP